WTMENLNKVGYLGLSPDHLYMRRKGFPGPVENFKMAARTEIEQKFNVTIIANVGDQDSDLVGGHAERTFKVPNPFISSRRGGPRSQAARTSSGRLAKPRTALLKWRVGGPASSIEATRCANAVSRSSPSMRAITWPMQT